MLLDVPIITDIRPQKRRRGRVSIFLDGAFWCGMDSVLASQLRLEVGQHLSEEEQERLEGRVTETEALAYALVLLERTPRSEAKLRDKLQERGYPHDIQNTVCREAKNLLLLDDASYAHALADSKRAAGWGRLKAQRKLQEAGIAKELTESVLDDAFAGDEVEDAAHALEARFQIPLAPHETRRAQAFLLRRGFSQSAATRAVQDASVREEDEAFINEVLIRLKHKYPTLASTTRREHKRALAWLLRQGLSFEASISLLRQISRSDESLGA